MGVGGRGGGTSETPAVEPLAATEATIQSPGRHSRPREAAEIDRVLRDAQARLPPRYQVKGFLGEGGMGLVLRVHDERLGRDVAVKLLGDLTREDHRTRFGREARAAGMIDHAGIVTVHDIGPGGDYIVMELIGGESLKARLARMTRLPAAEVRRIGLQLLDALSAAHRSGIVHRDVKPDNVLIDEHGNVKLLDLGIASLGDRDLTRTGDSIGTPAYMPPEQLRGLPADLRADVYAAGATLFEAATGQRLHEESAPDASPFERVLAACDDRGLAAAVDRAVEEHIADRFEDAEAFASALRAGEPSGEAPVAPPRDRTGVVAGPRRSARRWLLLAGLAVAVAAALLVVALGRRQAAPDRRPLAAPPAKRGPVVAILPFADQTGDARLDFARAGLPHILATELESGAPGLTVMGYYRLLDLVLDPAAEESRWIAAARRLDADIVVRGQLTRRETSIHMTVRATTMAGEALAVLERDVSVEEIPGAVRSIGSQLLVSILGQPLPGTVRQPVPFDAERNLQLGIAALEQNDFARADRHLDLAAAQAPGLVEVHYYRTVVDWWLSRDVSIDLKIALSGKLTRAQFGFLEGLQLLWDQHHERAIEHFEKLAAEHPDDREILYGLFEAHFHAGQPAEAASVYRRLCQAHPRAHLGFDHILSYYVSHGDEEGMAWSLERLGESPASGIDADLWRARVQVARRDARGAAEILQRLTERGGANGAQYQQELAQIQAVERHLILAADTISRVPPADRALAELSLQAARGGNDLGALHQKAVQAAGVAEEGPGVHQWLWTDLAALEAVRGDPAALGVVRQRFLAASADRHNRVPRVLLAAAAGDRKLVAAERENRYPDAAAVAKAFDAEWNGDWKVSAAEWRRAIAATGDGAHILSEWYYLARALRSAGDRQGAIEACDQVISPRLFAWAWAAGVGPCLQWTAEAEAALGHPDRARARWQELLDLRTDARPDDPLVSAARRGLERLGD